MSICLCLEIVLQLLLSDTFDCVLLNIFVSVGLDFYMMSWLYYLFKSFFVGDNRWNERVHEKEWKGNVDENGLLSQGGLLFHCLLCLNEL